MNASITTTFTGLPRRLPTLADEAFIRCLAEALVDQATRVGVIVTIERKPAPPLAMGHTVPAITTWPARTTPRGAA